jgi:hypothetical protein
MQLFISTHIASNYEYLINILSKHPRFIVKDGQSTYSHFTEINNEPYDIHCDFLLYNHSLASKQLYKICKYIFLIRSPEAVLSEDPNLLNYYCFRLQRMAQMSFYTKDAIFITWNELFNKEAFTKIEKFLNLKKPFKVNTDLERKTYHPVNKKALSRAERAYDKYVSQIMKNITN